MKEVDYYDQEVKENKAKLEEMKATKCDPYDIKKFQEVLDESYMMVPDSRNRLQRSLEDLADFLGSSDGEPLKSSEWYQQAKTLLDTVEMGGLGNDVKETDLTGVEQHEAF